MIKLSLIDVSVRFGGLMALSQVGFTVGSGEIVGLIGPNGAGKTTVFNVITGVYGTYGGDVVYDGRSILGMRPHLILKEGIARTFQNIRLFQNMTALENVMIARHARSRAGVFGAVLHTRAQRGEEAEIRDKAMQSLDFCGLSGFRDEIAKNLPYGLQRRLEIARALASEPRILLLDEPAAGLNPAESAELTQLVRQILQKGIGILMVEHDMKVVMGVCERLVVLDHGVLLAEGSPEEIRKNPEVIEAYLGQQTH